MYNILFYPYSVKSKIAAHNSATITRTYVAASLSFKPKKSSSKKIDELLKKTGGDLLSRYSQYHRR